jgi:uncharacterized sulfatase
MDDPQARGRVSLPDHRKTYSHDVMTDAALDFIRESHQQPFLLHVHWTIPHANNEGGRVLGDGMEVPDYGIYATQEWPNPEKGFAAMVTRMDKDVGRMLELLQELSIDGKTLVLFTSDNGPHHEGGHDHTFFDSNGPLRGYKRDLYEGGIRVPTIARWPGVIPAGSSSDEPLAFWDWLPTACELAGQDGELPTDGVSFVATLCGQPNRQTHHEYLFWGYQEKRAVRAGKWKAVRNKASAPVELYDLTTDLGEQHDVAAEHPDIVKHMERIIIQADAD